MVERCKGSSPLYPLSTSHAFERLRLQSPQLEVHQASSKAEGVWRRRGLAHGANYEEPALHVQGHLFMDTHETAGLVERTDHSFRWNVFSLVLRGYVSLAFTGSLTQWNN